jgi:cobalt/nickel transport system permease protein
MIEVIEQSAKTASQFFQNFLTTEKTVFKNGLLQKLDARIKIPFMFSLIILSITTFDYIKLSVLLAFLIFLTLTSKINPKILLSRIWLFTLFTFVIVSPKIFEGWAVSHEGLIYALTFTLRVAISLSSVSLIILTTSFSDIISTLRFFKVPDSFLSILILTYRYIHLTFSELFRIIVARESRRIKKQKLSELWTSGGNSLGLFFIRVFERSERIYLSSLARGNYYRAYSKPIRFSITEAFFITTFCLLIWWFI